jgi:hypothetical protein
MPDFLELADKGAGKKIFKVLAANGDLKQEDFDKRYIIWRELYIGILKSVFVTEDLSPAEAEVAYGIGLSVWGISEAKAAKLISRPLLFAPLE